MNSTDVSLLFRTNQDGDGTQLVKEISSGKLAVNLIWYWKIGKQRGLRWDLYKSIFLYSECIKASEFGVSFIHLNSR